MAIIAVLREGWTVATTALVLGGWRVATASVVRIGCDWPSLFSEGEREGSHV